MPVNVLLIVLRISNGMAKVSITSVETRADPGFFLRGGAPLMNEVADREVKKFKSEYVYTTKKASSQGGGVRTPCTLPLDPPLGKDIDLFLL